MIRLMSTSLAEVAADRHYGAKIAAVEPGGAEVIPLSERHGKPVQMLWTWIAPNMEFATILVGMLGVSFGLSFWQVFWAIVLGNVMGSATHAVLSSWGPGTQPNLRSGPNVALRPERQRSPRIARITLA